MPACRIDDAWLAVAAVRLTKVVHPYVCHRSHTRPLRYPLFTLLPWLLQRRESLSQKTHQSVVEQ